MVEFSARGKVCDFAFSGGSFYEFFMTIALAIPPLTVKNKWVRLFGTVHLIGQYGMLEWAVEILHVKSSFVAILLSSCILSLP